MPDVEAVNRTAALALTTDGELVPITNWFIGDGDDWPCEPDEADQCVAGPTSTGSWFRIWLPAFDRALS